MLSYDYTKDLLNLQGVIIDKIEQLEDTTKIHIHLPVKPHKCKCCGEITSYVHDYRFRTIKDISAYGKNTVLIYKQRRYVCKHCGKRFAEDKVLKRNAYGYRNFERFRKRILHMFNFKKYTIKKMVA